MQQLFFKAIFGSPNEWLFVAKTESGFITIFKPDAKHPSTINHYDSYDLSGFIVCSKKEYGAALAEHIEDNLLFVTNKILV